MQTAPLLRFVYAMKRFSLSVLGLLLAVPLRLQADDPQVAARAIVENEQKFFQMGQEQGTRAAFLAFLADESIVFRPGPLNGKQEWAKRPENSVSLKWKPLFVGMSRSADLAYSTGPSEWRKKKEDEKPFGYGQFISIWRKQKDGSWKVAVDVGNEVPGAPKNEQSEVEYWISEARPASDALGTPAKKFREAEAAFAAAAKADSTIALSEACIPGVRVHREGVFPAVGKEPARLMLSVRRGKLSLERLGGGLSEAGDLAYSYGKYALDLAQNIERGHYLQIWRTEPDGTWKIALDFQTPLPNEQKK